MRDRFAKIGRYNHRCSKVKGSLATRRKANHRQLALDFLMVWSGIDELALYRWLVWQLMQLV